MSAINTLWSVCRSGTRCKPPHLRGPPGLSSSLGQPPPLAHAKHGRCPRPPSSRFQAGSRATPRRCVRRCFALRSHVPSSDGAGGVSAGRDADACPGREDGGEEGRKEPAGDGEAGRHHCDLGRTRDAGGGASLREGAGERSRTTPRSWLLQKLT